MKLIEKAVEKWRTETREKIIDKYCPGDMGDEYEEYENHCSLTECKRCWGQTIKESGCRYEKECQSATGWCRFAKRDYEKCIPFIMQSYKNLETELKAYKDLGITPEQIKQMDVFYMEKCQELARLEECIKEGRPESKFIICQKRDCPNWQQDSCSRTFVIMEKDGRCLGAEQTKGGWGVACEEKKGSRSEEN